MFPEFTQLLMYRYRYMEPICIKFLIPFHIVQSAPLPKRCDSRLCSAKYTTPELRDSPGCWRTYDIREIVPFMHDHVVINELRTREDGVVPDFSALQLRLLHIEEVTGSRSITTELINLIWMQKSHIHILAVDFQRTNAWGLHLGIGHRTIKVSQCDWGVGCCGKGRLCLIWPAIHCAGNTIRRRRRKSHIIAYIRKSVS